MPRTLEVAADRLVVATARGLRVMTADRTIDVPRAELHAFATVGDTLWTVSGTPPMLEVDGLAERIRLPGDAGDLVRGTAGRAIWIPRDRGEVVVLARTADGIDATRLAGFDLALPLGEARMITCVRDTVMLRDATTRWQVAPVRAGRIETAAAILDTRAIALFVVQSGDRGTIVVVDARTGAVQHRIAIRGATLVRFAERRGVALLVLDGRRIVLLDLRFGRVLASQLADRAIDDAAIDDAGLRIVIRYDDPLGEVVELDADDLVRAGVSAVDNEHVDEAPVAPEPPAPIVVAPPPAVVASAPPVLGAIPALATYHAPAPVPAPIARELLATERGVVVALVTHAIARARDDGRAHDEVVRASVELDESYARSWDATASARPHVGPFDALADLLGLDELERQILAVIAAPALWGELARLYGQLTADGARPLCDELLVAQALATLAHPDEIAAALDPGAPLVKHGVVHVGAGVHRPFLALSIDPVVLCLIRGASPLAVLGRGIAVRPATRAFGALHAGGDVLARLAADLARAPAPLRIVVRGRSGSGRHTLLAAIAAHAGRELAVIDGTLGVDELAVALRRVALAGLVPCIDQLDRLDAAPARDAVRELVRRHAGPAFVRLPAEAKVPIEPGYIAVDLPLHTVAERRATWEAACAETGLTVPDFDELAARFALGPAVIRRVVEHAAQTSGAEPASRIEATIRQHLDREIAAVATRVERLPTWSSVILPPETQDSLAELIARIRHKRTVFDTWGFDRVMSTSRGLTALFQGGPGTGKTLVAGAIANELGLDLFRVDLSRIMSKWIGETEQNLARLFDAAQDGNAIILFDEADSLFTKRTEVKSSNDRFANLEVNYLLQRLDSFDGIAILTTNFGTAIDPAFKRRMSFRLTFPFPDEELRERLWRAHLPPKLPTRGTIDLAELARRYKLSGGYIRNCALRAAFLATEQGALTPHHLERAIQAEFREIGKLSDSGILE